MDNENKTAIANTSPSVIDDALSGKNFDINALSPEAQLAVVQDIMSVESEIEAMALPQINSTEILEQPINILDAAFRSVKDKQTGRDKACVSFVCEFAEGHERAGEQFTVLKGSNAFNDVYVTRFNRMRGVHSQPMQGYQFVEDDRYKVGDNSAHVLRKIQPQIAKAKSVNKSK